MWRRDGLNVNEIQANASSANPFRLSTIEAPTQGLITLEMPFATGQTSRPDPFGLGICYFRRLLPACTGLAG